MKRTTVTALASLLLLSCCSAPSPEPGSRTVLFADVFRQKSLDTAHWTVASQQIGRTRLGAEPELSNGIVHLTLETYDPQNPGRDLLGTEITTRQSFPVGNGLEFHVRARLRAMDDGIVAALFPCEEAARPASPGIGFEVLTKTLNTTPAIRVTGAGGEVPIDADLHKFEDYVIRWKPGLVQWLLNGKVIGESRTATPDHPMPFHLRLWAPDASWSGAYSGALTPAHDPAANRTYTFEVIAVSVVALP